MNGITVQDKTSTATKSDKNRFEPIRIYRFNCSVEGK